MGQSDLQPNMSQEQQWDAAHRRVANLNNLLMEMAHDPQNPLTNDDLKALIARRPATYGRFAGLVGKLPH